VLEEELAVNVGRNNLNGKSEGFGGNAQCMIQTEKAIPCGVNNGTRGPTRGEEMKYPGE